MEFAPSKSYQGAGLFASQDQDDFVRLARCFGGMRGGDRRIFFFKLENREPSWSATATPMATTADRSSSACASRAEQDRRLRARNAAGWSTGPVESGGAAPRLLCVLAQAGVGTEYTVRHLARQSRIASKTRTDFDWFRLGK